MKWRENSVRSISEPIVTSCKMAKTCVLQSYAKNTHLNLFITLLLGSKTISMLAIQSVL